VGGGGGGGGFVEEEESVREEGWVWELRRGAGQRAEKGRGGKREGMRRVRVG